MKPLFNVLFLIGLPFISQAQQTIEYTITHDGLQREYILYVPASYSGNDAVPLLLNFHALGSNAQQQIAFGDFRSIADTAGFLVAHPQGTQNDEGINFWNIGEVEVDDVGFTAAIIDSIDVEYNIDRDRVYATGMSIGGFFSHHLAGLLSEEIAAIASVSGSMTPYMADVSAPVHPTPVMQIHGTTDPIVPYEGNPAFLSVAEVLQYWVDYNNCDPAPIITPVPDINPDNPFTVEHVVYEGGDSGVAVEHLKVYGGTHAWPRITEQGGGNDIDASGEIWAFLSRYTLTDPIGETDDNVIDYTIIHDGLQREYILYVPDSYTGSDSVPLLFNFHGMGGTADDQMEWGDFRPIADSAGFLVVHPQGTENELGVTFWNIGNDPTLVDDIGFTEAMIDSIGAEYSIDLDRVYATGKSLGGFFSIHLAGQLSEKIAAIASVSGTMTQGMYDNMSPLLPTPFLHIHGTEDLLVPYDGNLAYLPVSDVLDYWIDYNHCNTTPIVTQLPDIDPNDGTTVERHVYEDGDQGVTVEHLKVFGGGHSWPGSNDPYPGTSFDFDGSEEIWNFLSRYDKHGLIDEIVGIEPPYDNQMRASFSLSQNYPNPFNSQTIIRFALEQPGHVTLRIYNDAGQLIQTLVDEQKASGEYSVVWNGTDAHGSVLNSGMYFYRIETETGHGTKSMILLK
jgi:polyhydroxybutyrate depolymerase